MNNASEVLINKVKAVLESELTPYRIAKELGFANATTVHKYKKGDSDINNMSLKVAAGFEKLYEEMINVINVKRTEVLTDPTLKFFALPKFKEEFKKLFKEENTREILMIIDEDFYKTLLVNPVVTDERFIGNFVEGALDGIKPYKYEYLSTMNNIHENEISYAIAGSETADFRISRRLAEPYRP